MGTTTQTQTLYAIKLSLRKMNNKELVSKLVQKIEILSKNESIFIVGITGLDASGKSNLSKAISSALINLNKNVLTISGDFFQFPREYKENFSEKTWALQHIKRTINFKEMVEKFLKPISGKPNNIKIDGVDYDFGQRIQKDIPLHYPLIIVLESIYLFQPSIVKYLNYKVFIDITEEEALSRAKKRTRDLELYGDEMGIEKKYVNKNFAGYSFFDKTVKPKQYSDIIIDNNEWEKPKVIKGLI
jgi:uridine kinase